MSGIYVVAADETAPLQLVTLASTLAGAAAVHLVVLGTTDQLDPAELEAAGASGLTVLVPTGGEPQPARAEAFVPALTSLLAGADLVLVTAGVSGREVAARVATGLGLGLIGEASALRRHDDEWSADRVVFAGAAVETQSWTGPAVVSMVAGRQPSGSLPAAAQTAAGRLTTTALDVAVDRRVRTLSRTARAVDAVDLAGAARVVCAGMGVGTRDDLTLVADLAEALGAELACTRPVAEDRQWLPTSRYIGISGVSVRPDVYVGVGVSGQVQHTAGMREARVVVGIDTNPDAKLLAQSDLAVVADQREIVPLLVARLRARADRLSTAGTAQVVPA